jgi:hypothetical protein
MHPWRRGNKLVNAGRARHHKFAREGEGWVLPSPDDPAKSARQRMTVFFNEHQLVIVVNAEGY